MFLNMHYVRCICFERVREGFIEGGKVFQSQVLRFLTCIFERAPLISCIIIIIIISCIIIIIV